MCGIYGFIGTTTNPEKLYKVVRTMAVATESRGIHSSGVAAINDKEAFHSRDTLRATDFYKRNDINSIIQEKPYFFVGHNRWASIGEITAQNAHPFFGDNYFFAHNGTVPEAKEVADQLKIKREGTTDSESMMALAEKYGNGIFSKFSDLSVVMINHSLPEGSMIFYRDHYKPMVTCDIRDTMGVVLFASTKEIVEEGLKKVCVNYKRLVSRIKPTPTRKFVRYDKNGDCKVDSMRTKKEFTNIIEKHQAKKKEEWRKLYESQDSYWSTGSVQGRQFKRGSAENDEARLFNLYKN